MKPLLNAAQTQAVEHTGSPLLIVAGAGTGKTTVIAEKIAYLIEQGLARPEEILALTFTEKAAEEMAGRVESRLALAYSDMAISTFHAFCETTLQRHGLDIGLSNQFRIYTDTDAWLLMREHLDALNLSYYRPLGNPTKHIRELIHHFAKCKDELITAADYLAYAEEMKLNTDSVHVDDRDRVSEIARAYHTYNQLLLSKNALDFADLIFYTIKLLEERPAIRARLQAQYKYILVDEFQDVNWAQYQLVRLLAGGREGKGEGASLTVVGDDDQSIYAFRGASIANILRFKDDYPGARSVVLNQNYRSGQAILDVAYRSIQENNPDRLEVKLSIDKKLIAAGPLPDAGRVEHLAVATLDEEVAAVVGTIGEIKQSVAGATWDDFAILVRANNHAEPFLHGLETAGIPYEFLASAGLYREPIVLDGINFFKIITDSSESSAVYRLLRLPPLGFSEVDTQTLTQFAHKKSLTYYEALGRLQECPLTPEGMNAAQKILGLIQAGMKQAKTEKPTKVLYAFLEKSGYLSYLAEAEKKGDKPMIRQIYQLKQFFDAITEYERSGSDAHVRGFMAQYQYLMDAGDDGALYQPTDTPDSVNVLTVHAAKGLEFRYVFVVNLVEERFPTRTRGDAIVIPAALLKERAVAASDAHYAEERRLFYVAATRAKERLYFASAGNYGGVRKKKISRFLSELKYGEASEVGSARAPSLDTLRSPLQSPDQGLTRYELPKAFSFSQIKTYETCPYQYKLAHILKIPTRSNASFSFGQTMHLTLQEFYTLMAERSRAQQGSLFAPAPVAPDPAGSVKAPTLEELYSMYEKNWIDDWYESKRQKDDYYKKGREILRVFYASESGNWSIPVSLEGSFKIKVGDYLMRGRIDRIDRLPDGTLEIIDYKTGKAKEKVTGEEKEQLLIYQIAAETLPQYRHVGRVGKLTFYYLNDNVKTSFVGSGEEMDALKEKLGAVMNGIHARNFTATPSQYICKHCNFFDMCEYRAAV